MVLPKIKILTSIQGLTALGGGRRAVGLRRAYEQTGNVNYLKDAARHAANTAKIARGHPDEAGHLSNLGGICLMLYQACGDVEALRLAAMATRGAVELAESDDVDRPMYLSNLGSVLIRFSVLASDERTAAEALAVARMANELAAADDPQRPYYLSNLGLILLSLGRLHDDEAMLAQADQFARTAVAAVPVDDPRRYMCVSNLGMLLRTLAERSGDDQVLAEAVQVARTGVKASKLSPFDQAGGLSALAAALLRQYEKTGETAVLDEAVSTGRAAVAACPHEHFGRPIVLSNLAIILVRLFERTGDGEALDEAVGAAEAAVAACPMGHGDRAMFLTNLSGLLGRVFQRTNDVAVIEDAVRAARAAVDLVPADHAERARYLGHLGLALRTLFEAIGDPLALRDALRAAREGLALSRSSLDTPQLLHQLATTLLVSYEASGDAEALAEAIARGREAIAALADGHPDIAMFRQVLGLSLFASYELLGDGAALLAARRSFAAVCAERNAPVSLRIDGGQAEARAAELAGDPLGALAAMESVIELLPLAAPRTLRRLDRQYQLGAHAGLAAQAAAAALAVGQPERAIGLLEQTRGLLLGEVIGARGEIARLRQHYPDLADELERLRDRLTALETTTAAAAASTSVASGYQPLARQDEHRIGEERQAASLAWDQLISRIRGQPELADFLRPPSVAQLREYVRDGAAIIVTADTTRSDALILTENVGIRHVPLPDLSAETVEFHVDQLQAALDVIAGGDVRSRSAKQAEIKEILTWLWDVVAAPVFAELERLGIARPGRRLQVWWCPVGLLGFLPLHAAGYHDSVADTTSDRRTVMDRAVSSYTATIRALAHTRRPSVQGGLASALIVAAPLAAGELDLPGARDEARAIAELLSGATILEGTEASRQAVIDVLPDHRIAHFACHGVTDWTDPSASALQLADHDERPLTVGAISRLDMTAVDLAYLSACSTANTSPELIDEAVHITAAFQLAGYRQVIGTLWPIADNIAYRAAKIIYSKLTSNGSATPDTSVTPVALHEAVLSLRARYPDEPAHWAAFIHSGGSSPSRPAGRTSAHPGITSVV